jgi:hypothetical protein
MFPTFSVAVHGRHGPLILQSSLPDVVWIRRSRDSSSLLKEKGLQKSLRRPLSNEVSQHECCAILYLSAIHNKSRQFVLTYHLLRLETWGPQITKDRFSVLDACSVRLEDSQESCETKHANCISVFFRLWLWKPHSKRSSPLSGCLLCHGYAKGHKP